MFFQENGSNFSVIYQIKGMTSFLKRHPFVSKPILFDIKIVDFYHAAVGNATGNSVAAIGKGAGKVVGVFNEDAGKKVETGSKNLGNKVITTSNKTSNKITKTTNTIANVVNLEDSKIVQQTEEYRNKYDGISTIDLGIAAAVVTKNPDLKGKVENKLDTINEFSLVDHRIVEDPTQWAPWMALAGSGA
ncbi:hypothetical protein [Sebaldella termitidis]|uniref:hypothetical protein n=1 Tax=Sebaldella termitidis TaxID=826 RepID=UPI003EB8B380